MLEALAFCWLLAEGAVCSVMRHRVLICGHSMVFWTARQARRSHFGSQLGLSDKAIIEWRGFAESLLFADLLLGILPTRINSACGCKGHSSALYAPTLTSFCGPIF
ncbi:uncharacterized protein LOC121926287 isoform X2 [Sceloporus undulatus]|uniref:uncharacterized protein LOC121926287 isoform X2 n=1 Tax=Sceloporus undulatus TaxID=8520 RepID=UPI001C4C7B8B|nr:uncharacterized protein LOC121926287 isoform X2 [Sceloporus undulatus]